MLKHCTRMISNVQVVCPMLGAIVVEGLSNHSQITNHRGFISKDGNYLMGDIAITRKYLPTFHKHRR